MLAAVVALVVAFAALRPSDDDPAGPGVASTPAPEPTLPATTEGTPSEPAPTTPAEPPATTEAPPEPAIPTITVVGGKPKGGVLELEAESGDDIVFRVKSDVKDHVHVHGYDKMFDVSPGKTVTVRIENAELEGKFEVELEDRGIEIAELTVSPS